MEKWGSFVAFFPFTLKMYCFSQPFLTLRRFSFWFKFSTWNVEIANDHPGDIFSMINSVTHCSALLLDDHSIFHHVQGQFVPGLSASLTYFYTYPPPPCVYISFFLMPVLKCGSSPKAHPHASLITYSPWMFHLLPDLSYHWNAKGRGDGARYL